MGFFTNNSPVPLQDILGSDGRIAVCPAGESTDRFLAALGVYQLDDLRPALAAILDDDPVLIGQTRHHLPILSLSALYDLSLSAVIVTREDAYRRISNRLSSAEKRRIRLYAPWEWTFSETSPGSRRKPEKIGAPLRDSTRESVRPDHVDNAFSETVTLASLLKVSSERSVDDILTAYSDPEWVRRHMDEVVWISPREPHPFLGDQLVSGVFSGCRINSHHMRSPRDITIPKPPGTIRIFLVGASTAYSAGAPSDDHTIGQYMEQELNGDLHKSAFTAEVFTAATPQWSSTHERIVIENRISRLEPDLVVSLTGAADIFWTSQGQDTLEVASDWFQHLVRVFNGYLRMVEKPLFLPYPRPKKLEATFQTMAQNLADNVRQSAYRLGRNRVPYLVALQPTLIISRKKKSAVEEKNYQKAEYRCLVTNAQVQEGYRLLEEALEDVQADTMRFVDLTGVFDDCPAETLFLDAFHFGDKGNEIIGKTLARQAMRMLRALAPGESPTRSF